MTNPFLAASTLPYQLPPFADIRVEHYKPAFLAGFEQQLDEIRNITRRRDMPTFENTMEALERSGAVLDRVATVFFNQSSADTNDDIDALEEELAPLLAAHSDAIRLDGQLYWCIKTLHDQLDSLGLDAEARYLVERYYTEFTIAGAGLDDEQKATLRDLNARLAGLTTRYEKNLLADTNDLAVHFATAEELEGLDAGELASAAQAAADRGLDGYLVTLVLFSGHPWLAAIADRASRERVMTASRSRGIRGGDNDNRQLVLDISALRADRARLLGFDTHAAWVTADETARTPEAVAGMLNRLAPIAARNARAEQADLEQLAGHPIEAHDWAYYSEKVRAAKYAVDTAAMKPYFEAERVLQDGVFFAATALYGVTFAERPDLTAYHPDARVFEVSDEDGSPVGLYVYDLYTRDSKRGGAWMNSLVDQSSLLGVPSSIVTNNLNVPKPPAGSPTLLSFDEVETLFHEFGHALHGLFARVTYPKFSGTAVFRDFVEFPSQVNEMWMLWPEVLANYAMHHETGEAMPQQLVDRLVAASAFNEGFGTSEYLAASLLDQAWHTVTGLVDASVEEFEAAALAEVGLDNPAVPPRYASTYFAHVFSGGYDAGYYSYIWSEVLDADTVEWFRENGGLNRENGERFRRRLLQTAGTRDPLAAFRDFRGRDARIEPLLERRGLD